MSCPSPASVVPTLPEAPARVERDRAQTESAIEVGRGSYGVTLISGDKSVVWKLTKCHSLSRSQPDANGFESTTTRELAFLHSRFRHPSIIQCIEAFVEPLGDILKKASRSPRAQSAPGADSQAPLRHHLLRPPKDTQARITLDYGGVTLHKWVTSGGLAEQDVDFPWILYQLLHVLAVLEAFDAVHNDLKPWNITIDPVTKRVRIIDWGSVVLDSHRVDFQRVHRTQLCTWEYAAPEVHPRTIGGPRGPMCFSNDVFSLGMTMLLFIHHHDPDPSEVVKFCAQHPKAEHLDVWHMVTCQILQGKDKLGRDIRFCNHADAVARYAPNFTRAVPILEKMLIIDPTRRPRASRLLNDSYFSDEIKSRLPSVKQYVDNVKHPDCDQRFIQVGIPEVETLFQQHPTLNVAQRKQLLTTLRFWTKVLKSDSALTLAVSLLDRFLSKPVTLIHPAIVKDQYKVMAIAALFVASDLRFCNAPWLDFYTLTFESLALYPPVLINRAVELLMDRLGFDAWVLTFDAMQPFHHTLDQDIVFSVMQKYPMVEMAQHQLCRTYQQIYQQKHSEMQQQRQPAAEALNLH